jgi:hypothetical protein
MTRHVKHRVQPRPAFMEQLKVTVLAEAAKVAAEQKAAQVKS